MKYEEAQTFKEYYERMTAYGLTPFSRARWESLMVRYYGGYNDGTKFERRDTQRAALKSNNPIGLQNV